MSWILTVSVIVVVLLLVSQALVIKVLIRKLQEVSGALNRMYRYFQEQDDMRTPYRNGAESSGKHSLK